MPEKDEEQAINDLLEVATRFGISTLAIGANTRQLILDQRFDLATRRITMDWDFAIQLKDWPAYDTLIQALTTAADAKFHVTAPHRVFHTATKVRIDLVPFGGIAAPDGTLRWPESELEMSVIAFDTALQHAETVLLGERELRVATLHWHVALKLLAYADRKLDKDTDDVDFMLSSATEALGDRIFNELADMLAEGTLSFDAAGAYLLGKDLAREATADERQTLLTILEAEVLNEPEYPALSRLARATPDDAVRMAVIDKMIERFEAFRRGLQEGE